MKIMKVQMGQTIQFFDGRTMRIEVVGESCFGRNGQWICASCKMSFANQLQKDSHITDGNHTLAWLCPEHGVEVP